MDRVKSEPNETWFEVRPEDFRRTWWRRGKQMTRLLAIVGAVILPLVYVWAWRQGIAGPADPLAVLIGEAIAVSVAWWKSLQLSGMNRFGIFRTGISPPKRLRSFGRPRGRLVIPYGRVVRIEFGKLGEGPFPGSNFTVDLALDTGDESHFDATEIFAQTRWKEAETARAGDLLETLAAQFRQWQSSSRGEPFEFRP